MYLPERSRAYRAAIRAACAAAIPKGWDPRVRMAVKIYSAFGDMRRRDIDNVAKAVLDALGGSPAMANDEQVDFLSVLKARGSPEPALQVEVRDLSVLELPRPLVVQ